ncbi:MAG: knotted carbamoyltransferase YgeW [Myxococcota bacterium]|jgi:knotted carbamoyltransferase YgeW|nr:knotted carbamoyltransferase YgeW [Myxococcota bacterium]
MSEPILRAKNLLVELKKLDFYMYRQDFLLSWEKKLDDIKAVLTLAEIMRGLYRDNVSLRVFQTGLAISNFRDMSTRTRMAFASACNLLGLTALDMDESKTQVAHGETVRETANMISFLSEVIGIRDDLYIGKGHSYMQEVAAALDDGFAHGVLGHRPAVINLQCDQDHPTQTLADLQHLSNHFGGLDKLRGKKIAMSWAYSPSYAKPLSVPQGIIGLMTRFGADVTLAHPEGYDLMPDIVDKARGFAAESGGSFALTHDMREAFEGADVVYPKSWGPFEVMKKRTDLLERKQTSELKELEQECLAVNRKHVDWVCNEEMMSHTKDGSALYLHCLPADVEGLNCERGEVTAGVFDKYRIDTYFEARNKPFVIAAMIMLCSFRDPVKVIDERFRANENRNG